MYTSGCWYVRDVSISGSPLSLAAPSPSAGGGGEVNVGAIAGGASAAIVVLFIAAGVPVLWLVRRHRNRKVTISLQEATK